LFAVFVVCIRKQTDISLYQDYEEEVMLAILGWIVFGLIVGIIAKMIMPGDDPGGVIITILIGIAGSLIGGFIGQALFGYGRVDSMNDLNQPGFLMSLVLSVVGAIALLAGYRLIRGRSLRA
jgi:uncharacterized membrane protein YeaQ/YmgE (transglycosylase-associated protein family)